MRIRLSGRTIFSHIIWKKARFFLKVIEHNVSFDFLYNIFSEIFLSLRWIQRDICLPHSTNPVPYFYWTVHHLDSWIKRDQLDVICFFISSFNTQHVSDDNTSILRSLRLICWVISRDALLWYEVCWCYVVVWLGWCGTRMQVEAMFQPASGYHTTPAKPHRNTNTRRTRAIQPMKYLNK
jgi:hypothetical protein